MEVSVVKVTCYLIVCCTFLNVAVYALKKHERRRDFADIFPRFHVRSDTQESKTGHRRNHEKRSGSDTEVSYIQFLADIKEQSLAQSHRRMGTGKEYEVVKHIIFSFWCYY